MAWLTDHELAVRFFCFAGVFAAVASLEVLRPRREIPLPRLVRWPSNLALVAVDTLVLRVVFPILAVGLAQHAAERGWGLLNAVGLSFPAAFVLSLLALDLVIYLQHVLFHAVPALWRLHAVHHADTGFDVTTALRFHPLEILLSMVVKLAAVAALGPPAVAVLAFEVVLNATAMFNHGNLRLPASLDRGLRWFLVTPDMHRVHHSMVPAETNSNFGFNVPWWDRLFGTYRAQPAAGHDRMTIGLEGFRDARDQWLDRLLLQPFRRADR
jgi:sterol desaturase/sphingolipid hydroxylase (fatty acid hydroxylase superfamily)